MLKIPATLPHHKFRRAVSHYAYSALCFAHLIAPAVTPGHPAMPITAVMEPVRASELLAMATCMTALRPHQGQEV